MKTQLNQIITDTSDRLELWTNFVNENKCSRVAELGVYKGDFAATLLDACPSIEQYLMIDPWRNLSDWNKPANKDDDTVEAFYKETMEKTDFAKEKINVLRGKTTEVVGEIENDSLDFIYIDGDHTLKGISIDLINIWSKVKSNGFIGGDDFSPTIWQHGPSFEPTMVFPFAVYFAEAMQTKIYGLPFGQFLITKDSTGFEFVDLTEQKYKNTSVLFQINNNPRKTIKGKLVKYFPGIHNIYKKVFK